MLCYRRKLFSWAGHNCGRSDLLSNCPQTSWCVCVSPRVSKTELPPTPSSHCHAHSCSVPCLGGGSDQKSCWEEDRSSMWGEAMWTPLYSCIPSPPTQGLGVGWGCCTIHLTDKRQSYPLTSYTQMTLLLTTTLISPSSDLTDASPQLSPLSGLTAAPFMLALLLSSRTIPTPQRLC